MSIIITGAAGFIGSNFILNYSNLVSEKIIGFDKLTYAGNLENLKTIKDSTNFKFIDGDIVDSELVANLLNKYQPRAIINFAAESHVDRSIIAPDVFMQTNIMGTYSLLEEARKYFISLNKNNKNNFRFLHVSTDEVYGTLAINEPPFREDRKYMPNNPYSASKAASDHLVRAWHHTYSLPVLTINCSNNYGPFQLSEKFIPLCITRALQIKPIPIYGDGKQIRDWLYVIDHCNGILTVLEKGIIGETYNIGGWNEKTNLEVAQKICELLDELKPRCDGNSYQELITFVKERPSHDRRYAIDASKIYNELGWKPKENFETGIRKTLDWHLDNESWSYIHSHDYQYLHNNDFS